LTGSGSNVTQDGDNIKYGRIGRLPYLMMRLATIEKVILAVGIPIPFLIAPLNQGQRIIRKNKGISRSQFKLNLKNGFWCRNPSKIYPREKKIIDIFC